MIPSCSKAATVKEVSLPRMRLAWRTHQTTTVQMTTSSKFGKRLAMAIWDRMTRNNLTSTSNNVQQLTTGDAQASMLCYQIVFCLRNKLVALMLSHCQANLVHIINWNSVDKLIEYARASCTSHLNYIRNKINNSIKIAILLGSKSIKQELSEISVVEVQILLMNLGSFQKYGRERLEKWPQFWYRTAITIVYSITVFSIRIQNSRDSRWWNIARINNE